MSIQVNQECMQHRDFSNFRDSMDTRAHRPGHISRHVGSESTGVDCYRHIQAWIEEKTDQTLRNIIADNPEHCSIHNIKPAELYTVSGCRWPFQQTASSSRKMT